MRQRLARALPVIFVAGALLLAGPIPSFASTSSTYTTTVTVGASRTLPSGGFGASDGCEVGIGGTLEFRCAFEFDISIPSSAKITTATLNLKKTAGPGCFASDCPIDIYAYNGNGNEDLSDVTAGSLVRIFSPDGSFQGLDVSADLQARVSNGLDWIGYDMRRDPSSKHSPDVQDFDISGATRVSLSVSYVAQPVDVTVQLGGSGTGVVTSSPSGISCGERCTATYEYAEPVTLTAEALDYGSFNHWQGGECDGSTNPVCEFIVPALDMVTTAIFDPLGPPISQPPGPTPAPTPTQLTPPPLPTSHASSGPRPTGGPVPTAVPPTDVIASDGTIITPPPPAPTEAAVAASVAPTIIGLDDPDAAAAGSSSGIGLPIVILLILLLGGLVGGGVYWYTKRQQSAAP